MLKWRWSSLPTLACVLSLSLFASFFVVSHYEPNYREAQAEAKTQHEKEAFDILASERVAYYTKVLAILSAALTVTGIVQGALIYLQVQLGRDEFNATHRPKLVLRDVDVVDEEILYLISNVGDARAILLESWILTEVPYAKKVRNVRADGHNTLGHLTFEPGETRQLSCPWPQDVSYTTLNMQLEGKVHFAGEIIYVDRAGHQRRSVFRRICDLKEGDGFRRSPDPDHEYAD
jgi:hypothetical protein